MFLNTQESLRADVSVHVSLARALDRGQVRVSVATSAFETPGDSARAAFESIPDLTLLPLDLGRPMSQQRGLKRVLAMLHNIRAIGSITSLALWCRKHAVDVIHVTERPRDAMFGLLLARLAGCACLIHAHTSYYPHPPSRTAELSDWVVRHAEAVVGVSDFTASTFRRDAGVSPNRVHIVHNAVDTTILHAQPSESSGLETRRRFGIPLNMRVIGSVGRLMQGKDQASLLEAFSRVRRVIPDTHLIIAGIPADVSPDGRGDYRDYLLRRVKELGLESAVTFTGLLPHGQMPELFGTFDVFVHPCVEEPFGLVIVEAMARARPVIAVKAGGVPEIIRDGVDGILVPPRQPAAIAEAIVGVLSDPAYAAQLVHNAHERLLTSFTPDAQVATMARVYRLVVASRRGRQSLAVATA